MLKENGWRVAEKVRARAARHSRNRTCRFLANVRPDEHAGRRAAMALTRRERYEEDNKSASEFARSLRAISAIAVHSGASCRTYRGIRGMCDTITLTRPPGALSHRLHRMGAGRGEGFLPRMVRTAQYLKPAAIPHHGPRRLTRQRLPRPIGGFPRRCLRGAARCGQSPRAASSRSAVGTGGPPTWRRFP